MGQSKFDELESIRGIAALLVVLVHVPKWGGILDYAWIPSLALMVDLFFVLSGFVIFWTYGDKLHAGVDVARFQFLRFGRLYPVHLLFLVLYLCLEVAKLYASRGMEIATPAFAHNTLWRFVQNLFLVQALAPGSEVSFNLPSWSISVEYYTYLLFAVIVLLARRWALFVLAATAAAALTALSLDYTASMEPVLRCWAGFFVGCLLASAYRKRLHTVALPAIAPLGALLAMGVYLALRPPTDYGTCIYPLSALLIVTVLCSRRGVVRAALISRPLVLLGTLSYSVYMSHHFLVSVFEIFLNRVLHMPAGTQSHGGYIAALTPAQAAIAFGAYFAVVLTVSWLTYRYVEQPFRLRSRRIAGMVHANLELARSSGLELR